MHAVLSIFALQLAFSQSPNRQCCIAAAAQQQPLGLQSFRFNTSKVDDRNCYVLSALAWLAVVRNMAITQEDGGNEERANIRAQDDQNKSGVPEWLRHQIGGLKLLGSQGRQSSLA